MVYFLFAFDINSLLSGTELHVQTRRPKLRVSSYAGSWIPPNSFLGLLRRGSKL